MPKLHPMTPAELAEMQRRVEALTGSLASVDGRLQRTAIDGAIANPIELAAAFLRLSTRATETALKLMHRPAMDELRAATEAELMARQNMREHEPLRPTGDT